MPSTCVNQSLTGDGAVTAHVTSQQNTDPFAKAGAMLRATTDPGSPYYAAFVTPGNGIAVQWRATQAGTSSQLLVAGTTVTGLSEGRPATPRGAPIPRPTTAPTRRPTAPPGPSIPGSTQALGHDRPLLAGFGITSHAQGTGSAVTLDTVARDPG